MRLACREKHDVRAVLQSGDRAARGPARLLARNWGFPGGEAYELTGEHLRQWKGTHREPSAPRRYLLLAKPGTSARLPSSVRKYRGAKQLVVQGGDHTLVTFPNKSRSY